MRTPSPHRGTRLIRWRTWRRGGLFGLGLLLALSACGGAARQAEPTRSPAGSAPAAEMSSPAHQEIAALWAEIQDQRARPGGDQVSEIESESLTTDSVAGADSVDAAAEPDPAPMSLAGAGPDPEQVRADIRGPEVECPASSEVAVGDSCGDVCTLGSSICDSAGRICELASELDGDAWARGKCVAAADECGQATARCCSCRE